MNLNTFPKDVLVYMALDMDIGDIISLCKGNKELNLKICENKDLWYNKLNKDFPSSSETVSPAGQKSSFRRTSPSLPQAIRSHQPCPP